MADSRNLILKLLITAKDEASSVFSKVFKALNDNTNVIAGKVREAFTGLFNITDEAQAFEVQLARVQSKSNASAAEMAKLKQAALDMGRQMGISAIDAAQGLEILTGAGLTVDQAISALAPTLRVMATEQVGAAEAAGALTDALALMGVSLDQAGRAGDVLQAGADATSTSVMEMAEAMRGAGAAASGAGLTLEQTATILTAFAKYGLKGAEAGTALGNMLNLLNDPTSKARVELAKLGQTSGDVAEMINTLTKAGPRGGAAMLAFGEAQSGVNALLKTGVAGFAEYGAAIDASSGGLKKAADTIDNTTAGALDNLTAAWQQVKLALTGPLLEPIAKGAQELATRLGELANSGYLEKIGQGIADVFVQGGQQVMDFLKTVNWEQLQADATAALTTIRTTINTIVTEVKANTQAIADWGALAFAPMTTAIDSLRAAYAAGKGDTEALNAIMARLEERTAAVGRALAGTSGELARNAGANRELTTATHTATLAQQRQAAAIEEAQQEIASMSAALKDGGLNAETAAAYTERLRVAQADLAKAQGQATAAVTASLPAMQQAAKATDQAATATAQYQVVMSKTADGMPQFQQAQLTLGAGIAEVARGVAGANVGMTEWNGALVKSHEGVTKLGDGLPLIAKSLTTVTEITAEYNRQIKAGNDNAGAWRSGMELNGVTMMGLRDAAAATAEKLAYLQSIQATLPDADRQIAAAKQAATQAQNTYNQAIEENIKQQERAVQAAQRATTLAQGETDLKLQQVKAEIDLAEAKGNTEQATQKQNEATDLELQKIQQGIDGKQQEIAAYEELIAATQRKLAADGELDASDKNQLATMADTLTGLQQEQRGLEQTAEATRQLNAAKLEKAKADQEAAEAAKNAKEAEEARTSAGKAATKTMNDSLAVLEATGGEMDKLTQRFYEQQGAITQHAQGWDGWAAGTARAAQEVKQAYETQKAAVMGMTGALEQFNETGIYNANVQQAMIQAGGDLASQFDLMDQQSFNNLRAKLEDANQKLREMQQEAQDAEDALAEMNAELLAEQGDTPGADRLKLQIEESQRLADLEQKRLEAEQTGNQEAAASYAEMIAKLSELYRLKGKNLEADIKSRTEQERTTKTQTDTTGALATNLERAASAAQSLNGVSLAGLQGQVQGLYGTVERLRAAL